MWKIIGKVTPTAAAIAVATVLSAGGGAFAAAQITGAQIKNHTITAADVQINSLKKTNLAAGLKTEVDKANSAVQPKDLPSNLLHFSKTASVAATGSAQVTVTCDDTTPGYVAVGGGYTIDKQSGGADDTAGAYVTINRNTTDGKGWLVEAHSADGKAHTIHAWVTCLYLPNDDPQD